MLISYVHAAMERAHYEILSDEGSYYGEIRGFKGVYAHAPTLEECRGRLESVLEEWILFRVSRKLSLPRVNGIKLQVRKVA